VGLGRHPTPKLRRIQVPGAGADAGAAGSFVKDEEHRSTQRRVIELVGGPYVVGVAKQAQRDRRR